MLKSLLRSAPVQAALTSALAGYLRFALRTVRWRQEGLEHAEAVWEAKGGVVVLFWHGRIALSPACWPSGRAQPPRALISLSADGAFVAAAMERLGFPAIRGSSAKPSDPLKAKGGAQALRDALRWLRAGGGIAVTPDGPRGPAQAMGEGAPLLAKAGRAPTLLVGLAARPCLRLRSWDSAVLPLPFGRGAIVWDGPLEPQRDIDADLNFTARAWAERLTVATARAEAMLR